MIQMICPYAASVSPRTTTTFGSAMVSRAASISD
jgi:hypothetical protein